MLYIMRKLKPQFHSTCANAYDFRSIILQALGVEHSAFCHLNRQGLCFQLSAASPLTSALLWLPMLLHLCLMLTAVKDFSTRDNEFSMVLAYKMEDETVCSLITFKFIGVFKKGFVFLSSTVGNLKRCFQQNFLFVFS